MPIRQHIFNLCRIYGPQLVIVSSMGSLSSLYLLERAVARGIAPVASFGTTALHGAAQGAYQVNIMIRRSQVAISWFATDGRPSGARCL